MKRTRRSCEERMGSRSHRERLGRTSSTAGRANAFDRGFPSGHHIRERRGVEGGRGDAATLSDLAQLRSSFAKVRRCAFTRSTSSTRVDSSFSRNRAGAWVRLRCADAGPSRSGSRGLAMKGSSRLGVLGDIEQRAADRLFASPAWSLLRALRSRTRTSRRPFWSTARARLKKSSSMRRARQLEPGHN